VQQVYFEVRTASFKQTCCFSIIWGSAFALQSKERMLDEYFIPNRRVREETRPAKQTTNRRKNLLLIQTANGKT
jgi:hypothetical protein